MVGPTKLSLAQDQLERAQAAFNPPVDWSDLYLYAFYALENAVVAAAEAAGVPWHRTHPSKVQVASALHLDHALPDVSSLLRDLNELRKAAAYGEDLPAPTAFNPEDILIAAEAFIDSVIDLITRQGVSDE